MDHEDEQNIQFPLSYVLANSLRPEAVGNEEPLILRSSKLVASETCDVSMCTNLMSGEQMKY
jgi:hypothetical protein